MTTDRAPQRLPSGSLKPKVQPPPAHLSSGSRRLWRELHESYVLEVHHDRVLAAALESWDRKEQARRAILHDGLLVKDRFGALHANPAVAIERDSRTAFYRGIRELGLDIENPSAPRLPTAWRSERTR